VHDPSSAARPSQRLMITSLCARYTGERTIAALAPTGHPRSRAAPAGASAGENSLAHIWHGYLIFAAFRPLGSGGPDRVFSPPGWSPGVPCGWRQGGFCVRAGCTGGVRHRSRASPGPVRAPGLDLRFLVAGPGFEPGKTVAGDFTDRAQYCPDLGERGRPMPFWHAFDMTAPYEPHSIAAWQLAHRSCRVRAGRGLMLCGVTRGTHTRGGRSVICSAPAPGRLNFPAPSRRSARSSSG
jgi:hypothetical protein